MKLKKDVACFTGGGTAGHIYPGLAVVDELKTIFNKNNRNFSAIWLGCSKGMDKNIAEKATDSNGNKIITRFYGIPSGKLRRYFSVKNFFDVFKIIGGFFRSFFILTKEKPAVLFSKGGFVSVPPCLAAKILKIPVYTHECDFTLGLANKINLKSAKKIFVSYEETKNNISNSEKNKAILTGNPVRPAFYEANPQKGFDFLGADANREKNILLVLGGSSGASQINRLVYENIDFLCENFIVIHQTGLLNSEKNISAELSEKYKNRYLPYEFIYEQMPDVLACADVVLSRAGANSIWEAAVLLKPMILIPLCGSGTRGDQVDNALFFEKKEAAKVLIGKDANGERLASALSEFLDEKERLKYSENLKNMIKNDRPARKIAEYIYENLRETL